MLPPVMVSTVKQASQSSSWSRALLVKARQQAAKDVPLDLRAFWDVLFDLKYASCVYKVTVAIDSLIKSCSYTQTST